MKSMQNSLRSWFLFSIEHTVVSPVLQYAKLAISLRVPGGGKKKAAAAAAASGDAGAAPPEEDEDEYAGGLC